MKYSRCSKYKSDQLPDELINTITAQEDAVIDELVYIGIQESARIAVIRNKTEIEKLVIAIYYEEINGHETFSRVTRAIKRISCESYRMGYIASDTELTENAESKDTDELIILSGKYADTALKNKETSLYSDMIEYYEEITAEETAKPLMYRLKDVARFAFEIGYLESFHDPKAET